MANRNLLSRIIAGVCISSMLASGAALPAFAEKTNQESDKASTAESEVEPSGKTEKTTDPGKENASSGKSETCCRN